MNGETASWELPAAVGDDMRVTWTGPQVEIEFGRMPVLVFLAVMCRFAATICLFTGAIFWDAFRIHLRYRHIAALVLGVEFAVILAQFVRGQLRTRRIVASPYGVRWFDFRSGRGAGTNDPSCYDTVRVVRCRWAPRLHQLSMRWIGRRFTLYGPVRRTAVIAYHNDPERLRRIADLIEKARSMAPLRQTFEVIPCPKEGSNREP